MPGITIQGDAHAAHELACQLLDARAPLSKMPRTPRLLDSTLAFRAIPLR